MCIDGEYRVLHAIVGYQFPVYFGNAIRSVLKMAPDDDILVVDNASNSAELTEVLNTIASAEPRVRLLIRTSNDRSRNTKVGGLYDAYNEITAYAIDNGYQYLHILQNDMQMLWWDRSIIKIATDIFSEYPECVNIQTLALLKHFHLSTTDLEYLKPKLAQLRNHGVTDTGLYDLEKWRTLDMKFMHSEKAHAEKYWGQGLRVFFHPLPTVAPIPWPAVVRNGRTIGREVQLREEFLLRPLDEAEICEVKESTKLPFLEEIAIPWGWACRTPYWVTDLRAADYWLSRLADIRDRGLRSGMSRWERRGVPAGKPLHKVQRQPRFWLWQTAVLPPIYGILRGIRVLH